jgi:hypothetical protein
MLRENLAATSHRAQPQRLNAPRPPEPTPRACGKLAFARVYRNLTFLVIVAWFAH